MFPFLFFAAVVGGCAYLDVRKLPKGGGVFVEDVTRVDENGDPTGLELDAGDFGSWGFNFREELHKWLFGSFPT